MKCPSQKGYEVRQVNGVLACAYKTSPENYVVLKQTPTPTVQANPTGPAPAPFGYESLKEKNIDLYNRYKNEYERFNKEFAVVDKKIERERKIQDAFRELQD
jgi:hypothetical protein